MFIINVLTHISTVNRFIVRVQFLIQQLNVYCGIITPYIVLLMLISII